MQRRMQTVERLLIAAAVLAAINFGTCAARAAPAPVELGACASERCWMIACYYSCGLNIGAEMELTDCTFCWTGRCAVETPQYDGMTCRSARVEMTVWLADVAPKCFCANSPGNVEASLNARTTGSITMDRSTCQ